MSHPGPPLGPWGMTTVLLAGATGVFGRHVTRVLEAAGHQVIGLGRGPGNAVRADLTDRDGLLEAVRGRHADIVVHAATALAKPPIMHRDMTATDALRTTGMRNLVEAARAVGATRFIGENMIFGYGYGRHPDLLTEDSPFGPAQSDRRLDAHVAAMRIKEELTLGTPGLDGVSLRYGLFYGPGATEPLVGMLRRRRLPAPSGPGYVLPWVHLADAADAVLAAIEHGRAGTAYNIVDDEPIGFSAQIRATAAAFGTPAPLAVPGWLLRPAAMLTAILNTESRVGNGKAAAELGWKPRYRTVHDGLAAMTR